MDGARVVGETAAKAIAAKFAKMKAECGVEFDHWALKQADYRMKNLKVKFICDDEEPAKLESRTKNATSESFPGGDHIEFGITTSKGRYHHHFGVDCRNGRADIRNGDIGFNAMWESAAKITQSGCEVELSIDLESIGAEITKENRFGACFARMATKRDTGRGKEFSSWKGVHPQSAMAFSPIFISMEK